MTHRLPGLLAATAVLLGVFGLGSGCTPTEREFATGGQGGCPAGFVECDGDPTTVCETDTRSTLAHCGECNNACGPAPEANVGCVEGKCAITSCTGGKANCNNFYEDGCETNPTTNFENCGICQNSCEAPSAITACVAGSCQLAQCVAGKLDCDKDAKTGCEVDPAMDVNHCGACGMACVAANAMMACGNSQCAIAACNADFADCNMNATDGCEINIMTDISHCGKCGFACKNGGCRAGVCVEPTLLAQTNFSPGEIDLFKTDLYIGGIKDGEIAAVPVVGGAPVTLGMGGMGGAINALKVNSLGIFIAADKGAMRMNLDGSNPFTYLSAVARGITMDASSVYWSGSSTIRFAPIAGGAYVTFTSTMLNTFYGIALADNTLFWGTLDGRVWSSPTGMPTPTTIAMGPGTADNFVLDADNLYWSSSAGIHSIARKGGDMTTLAPTSSSVRAVALDLDYVYWTEESSGIVRRVLKNGLGTPEFLATGQSRPWGIAVDSQFVYWANSWTGEIYKVPK